MITFANTGEEPKEKLTGGKVNYYLVRVAHPRREEQPAYQAECEDIIASLGLSFDEACIFKAIWRSANARKANGKPGHNAIYDAEKIVHYAGHVLRSLKLKEADDANLRSRGATGTSVSS